MYFFYLKPVFLPRALRGSLIYGVHRTPDINSKYFFKPGYKTRELSPRVAKRPVDTGGVAARAKGKDVLQLSLIVMEFSIIRGYLPLSV